MQGMAGGWLKIGAGRICSADRFLHVRSRPVSSSGRIPGWIRSVTMPATRKKGPLGSRGARASDENEEVHRMVALCFSAAPRNFEFEKSQRALSQAFGRGSLYFDEVPIPQVPYEFLGKPGSRFARVSAV